MRRSDTPVAWLITATRRNNAVSSSAQQITRREILKRGAIVGGTVLWVTPVVQTLGMGRAFAATPSDTCVESFAVSAFGDWAATQGTRRDGTSVLAERSYIDNALGACDKVAPAGQQPFYSLGFHGSVILELGTPYYVGKGGQLLTIETTYGPWPLEQALVSVAGSSGGPWYDVGTAKNTLYPALAQDIDALSPGTIPANLIVTHVRIQDTSSWNAHDAYLESDFFDINCVHITCGATNGN